MKNKKFDKDETQKYVFYVINKTQECIPKNLTIEQIFSIFRTPLQPRQRPCHGARKHCYSEKSSQRRVGDCNKYTYTTGAAASHVSSRAVS
jgi:hypothetical protein